MVRRSASLNENTAGRHGTISMNSARTGGVAAWRLDIKRAADDYDLCRRGTFRGELRAGASDAGFCSIAERSYAFSFGTLDGFDDSIDCCC